MDEWTHNVVVCSIESCKIQSDIVVKIDVDDGALDKTEEIVRGEDGRDYSHLSGKE